MKEKWNLKDYGLVLCEKYNQKIINLCYFYEYFQAINRLLQSTSGNINIDELIRGCQISADKSDKLLDNSRIIKYLT